MNKLLLIALPIIFLGSSFASAQNSFSIGMTHINSEQIVTRRTFIGLTNKTMVVGLDNMSGYPIDTGEPIINKASFIIDSSGLMNYELAVNGCVKKGLLLLPIVNQEIELCRKGSLINITSNAINSRNEKYKGI